MAPETDATVAPLYRRENGGTEKGKRLTFQEGTESQSSPWLEYLCWLAWLQSLMPTPLSSHMEPLPSFLRLCVPRWVTEPLCACLLISTWEQDSPVDCLVSIRIKQGTVRIVRERPAHGKYSINVDYHENRFLNVSYCPAPGPLHMLAPRPRAPVPCPTPHRLTDLGLMPLLLPALR